jgi:REP element-mobilizing transposase RayT
MTAPRQILPGTTYLITRRCAQRQFLLRPTKITNELLGYLLAVAARRFHVDVHALCVMSNHVHLVVTDHDAQLPAFTQYLDGLVARSMNALLARWENFWAPSSYSAVALIGAADIVDKVTYVLANPVAAGLVSRGRKWPGLWSSPSRMGAGTLEYGRPRHFFREQAGSPMPARVMLGLVVPPGFDDAAGYREDLEARLADEEKKVAADLAARGLGFLGRARILAQRPTSRPQGPESRRELSPRVACRDRWRRIQSLRRLKEFLLEYRLAFRAWRQGEVGVVFPHGTYLMQRLHGARCAAPG